MAENYQPANLLVKITPPPMLPAVNLQQPRLIQFLPQVLP